MRILVQRVTSAKVEIDKEVSASIQQGLLVLVGICAEDTEKDIAKHKQMVEERKQEYISNFLTTLEADDFQNCKHTNPWFSRAGFIGD